MIIEKNEKQTKQKTHINTKISIKDYSIIMLYYNINNNIKI